MGSLNKPNRKPRGSEVAPGEGERRAQRGLVPQYKIAAEKVLNLLMDGRLHLVGIADPEAETQDDLQTIRRRGSALILDAYQVKWSQPGQVLIASEFSDLLAAMVSGHRAVSRAAAARAEQGSDPVSRVICHLYTSKAASTASLRGPGLAGDGRTLHAFLDSVWHPAQREVMSTLDDVPAKWHKYLRALASDCELEPNELLRLAPDLRIELSRELAEDMIDQVPNWQTQDRLKDLVEIRAKLQDLVSHRDETYVWLSAEELIEHLGAEWGARWRPRQEHHFPLAGPYEPVAKSVADLSAALDRFDSGYVVLTGSPGSGKSTLLTQLLRADDRLAARYYAYVPGNDTVTRGEAGAFLHDLYLALSGRQGRRVPAPRGHGLDLLRDAFRDELESLGQRAMSQGRTEIVLIDGLDHVSRDPKPQHSLLRELPSAEQIPEGVLLVLGTRGLSDLPSHIRPATGSDRHVELQPLERSAVLRLCAGAGLEELGEHIATLSGGHPLLVRMYMRLAEERDPGDRDEALAMMPPGDGEVWTFYETVWDALADQPETLELLGMISRLRGPIRRSWLAQTGSPAADLARLDRLRYLFDTRDPECWRFFHSSFREFLLRRSADRDGSLDLDLHRAQHRALADRCEQSPAQASERFDELYHLIESNQLERVLARATPAFFREQVDALRAPHDVLPDIQAAAGALSRHSDGLAAARLALSAHELQVRGYQFPESIDFLELLVALGQPELATQHLRAIDNGTSGHDRREAAMRLARALHADGHLGEAIRVFEEHEPLDWLGGPQSVMRGSPSGPFGGLYAWSRAAAQLRGEPYVIEMVARLRPPSDLDHHETERVPDLPAELLWSAADELIAVGKAGEVRPLREGLVNCSESGAMYAAMLDLSIAEVVQDHAERLELLNKLTSSVLSDSRRVRLAEMFLRAGESEDARAILEQIDTPELPEGVALGDGERREWSGLYRYWRLSAELNGAPDPIHAIPDPEKEHHFQIALGARHLVAMASLEGRSRAGESVTSTELLATLRRAHSFWDAPHSSHDDRRRSGLAMRMVGRRAISLAARLSPATLGEVLEYFQKRWAEQPSRLMFDGADLIRRFADAGAGEISLRASLEQLESLIESHGYSPEDWVELGWTWLALRDSERATTCCHRAVHRTLSPSSDKDLQLAVWIRLLDPLINGPDGRSLTDALSTALVKLEERASGGAPDYAARRLLDVVAPVDPDRGWELGKQLLAGSVLGLDEVIEALLGASAVAPSASWWILLGEVLVALGVGPPTKTLGSAAKADPLLAAQWLPFAIERVAVEGRPTERRSWRGAILDAAQAAGVAAGQLGIPDVDLEIGDETPEGRGARGEADESDSRTVEALLLEAEDESSPSYERGQPVRKLIERLDELDPDQQRRLVAAAQNTENETSLRVRLAAVALGSNDPDEAWEQGIKALSVSRSGDWSRHWGGGPILRLIPDLYALDHQRAKRAVFTRFSELAGETDYFLSTVGGALDDYVEALGLPAMELAQEVLAVAGALLRDVAPLPDPESLSEGGLDRARQDPSDAFNSLLLYLLGLEHTVAWQAAQRALVALVRQGSGLQALRKGLEDHDEIALRTCAVIQAAAGVLAPDEQIADSLEALAQGVRLDVRRAGARCLAALGLPVPPVAEKQELPAALRLELPSRGGSRRIVTGLEEMVSGWRRDVVGLAELADVDPDALHDYVWQRARAHLGTDKTDDDRLSRTGGILGWGYVKPSAQAIRAALAEAAASLFDAGRVRAFDALFAVGLDLAYDVALLERRPVRRSSAVTSFVPHAERQRLYSRALDEFAEGQSDSFALSLEGWVVLGECTEVTLLDRHAHYQLRRSGLTRVTEPPGPLTPHSAIGPVVVAEYNALTRTLDTNQGIIRSIGLPAGSPTGWLALHPGLAEILGLESEDGWLDWTLDGCPAVRSIWWRSGFLRWNPYSESDEVGEGWLVIGSPKVFERLYATGEWAVRWEAVTASRGESSGEEAEIRSTGSRALMKPGNGMDG